MDATAEQNFSYSECLRFDRLRFDERLAGRSGLLTHDQDIEHLRHFQVVDAAMNAGVVFDRASFAEAA